MTFEPLAADQFIFETLNAGALSGKVHNGLAPSGTAAPYVVFNQQAGTDVMTADGVRIMANLLYHVMVIGTGPLSSLQSLADAVDAALHKATGSVDDSEIYQTFRESTLTRQEDDAGTIVRYIDMFFRLFIRGG